jgi:hypothetical protein
MLTKDYTHHQYQFQNKGELIMAHIKVVWKDSVTYSRRPYRYRMHTIQGTKNGWVTDMEGDNNIYKTHLSAMNYIDKVLGETKKSLSALARKEHGITIIGQKDNETA